MLSSFALRVSISHTKNCYCKQMVADEIYSPCQDKEHTINREWAEFWFLVDDFMAKSFRLGFDLVPLNYFLEKISWPHFVFSNYFNRVRCLLDYLLVPRKNGQSKRTKTSYIWPRSLFYFECRFIFYMVSRMFFNILDGI